jgi:hypothetical protein
MKISSDILIRLFVLSHSCTFSMWVPEILLTLIHLQGLDLICVVFVPQNIVTECSRLIPFRLIADICESQYPLLCSAWFIIQCTEDDVWIVVLRNTGSGERSSCR